MSKDELLKQLTKWADEADTKADSLKHGSQARAEQLGQRVAYLRVANLLMQEEQPCN